MKVPWFAIGLVLAALSGAGGVRAQTAANAPAANTSALPLKLELGSSKLDAETVRKAVELELERPILLAAAPEGAVGLTVTIHPNHTATVSYRTGTGETRTRSIGIPEDGARAAEVIALLSGNLSRDEAAELLERLEAKPTPSAAETAKATTVAGTPDANAANDAPKPKPPPAPAPGAARQPLSPQPAQPSAPPPLIQTPPPAINLSLFPPLTLYSHGEQRIFSIELGLFYSDVGALRGAGVNAIALRTERDVQGVTVATFYNYTGGTVLGFSASAIFNRRQVLRGFEASGLLNLGAGDAEGAAAAGLANTSRDFVGLQTAGLMNWAAAFQGVQAAGLLNRVDGGKGLQVAGLTNFSANFQGLQTAGLYNQASVFSGVQAASANVSESVSGLQLGIVNVARDVHGMQLGVVNVAKRVHGTSIGLVSVAENGRAQPVFWVSSAQALNAAAKFTVGPIYTQAGLGYAPGKQTYSYELGVGGRVSIGRFFIEPGVHYSEVRGTKHPFDHELIEYGHYRVAAGTDLGRVSPFAGVGVLQRFAHSSDAPSSVPVTVEVFGGAALF